MNAEAALTPTRELVSHDKPLNLMDKAFVQNKSAYYEYLRHHLPVHRGRIGFVKLYLTATYEDCLTVVKSDRFGRNRTKITGGSRFPFPLPKGIAALAESMITEDDPEHRRQRNLVQKAFSPKSLQSMSERVTELSHGLLDDLTRQREIDLQSQYALQIPTAVIAQMMGVSMDDMPRFQKCLRVLSKGMSGWNVVRTLLWDIKQALKLVNELIDKKRNAPGDDILTQLIEAEEEGDKLSRNEIVSLVFLLIIAGYETTVHLITNGVHTLLTHPEQLARLRERPELMSSAVEEILRYAGPVQGTKMNFAREDIELGGVVIPKGAPTMPLLGSANRDENVFDNPHVFDIQRDPNKHLSFSMGNHFCLGAFLARMEVKLALAALLERSPNLALVADPSEIEWAAQPGWHKLPELRVTL